MNIFEKYNWQAGNAICYSGFREGQAPGSDSIPSYEQVKEDLEILNGNWKYLRLYDCDDHARTILEVIKKEQFDFQVMLGAYIGAEMNNFGCPWGGSHSEETLWQNKGQNIDQVKKLIAWANEFPEIINCLSVGNEATVHWTDHYVPVKSVIQYAKMVKKGAKQPVTFCENYVPWFDKLKPLAEVLDFISVHTYPVWEYKHIHEALEYTKQNYYAVCEHNPSKLVVITEAGWATNSNGRGIEPKNVNEEFQKQYYNELMEWTTKEGILTYVFEAFDEPWKGSPEPNEPEKHWGLFKVDRTPKLVMQKLNK